MIPYSVTHDHYGDPLLITMVTSAGARVIEGSHPNFHTILEGLEDEWLSEQEALGLLDLTFDIGARIRSLTDRVDVVNGHFLLDGNPMDADLAATLQHARTEEEMASLAHFVADLSANVNVEARGHLLAWVRVAGLRIDETGHVWGYKAVLRDEEDPDLFWSIHKGQAWVNGEPHNGQIPQRVGDVVTMPRALVDANPYESCSTGLHVGSMRYAEGFGQGRGGQVLALVRINPRDVAAVPASETAKMRVVRYELVSILEQDVPDVEDEDEADEIPAHGVLVTREEASKRPFRSRWREWFGART